MDAMMKNFTADRLENGGPDWLSKFRASAFSHFQKLPVETSELFKKYTDLEGVGWEQLDFSKAGKMPKDFDDIVSGSNIIRCDSDLIKADSGNVVFMDIISAVKKYDALRDYFSKKILPPDTNKIVAFNGAFFNSGYFLQIPDNTNAGVLRVANVFTPDNRLCVDQNIIIVGKNSSVTLVEEKYSAQSSEQSLLSSVTDVHVKEGAKLTMGNIHSLGSNTIELASRRFLLENDANVFASSGFFGGFITLSSTDYIMKGNGSSSEGFEIVFGTGKQRYNISSNLFHDGVGTNGKMIAKGVFDNSSSGLMKGMINIGKNAKNASAYLSDHSVLLGKDSSADAIPGLQIENNDVKATHSASVAQINEEQIFYLMSRGFSEKEAKKLIVSGFFEPIIRQMPLREVAFIIKGLFELKWDNRDIAELKDVIGKLSDEEIGVVQHDKFEGHYKYRK
ncbi:SufD family Fe-S cluster assembly protein [Candidatus Woesearchaeota archaeon]|nr:SufD family Fe-S cluster assembly protein [Candidatus Woesearchaeota archaeon]